MANNEKEIQKIKEEFWRREEAASKRHSDRIDRWDRVAAGEGSLLDRVKTIFDPGPSQTRLPHGFHKINDNHPGDVEQHHGTSGG